MEAGRAKRRLDSIFLFHAVASVITGGLAFALPHHITEAILGQGHMVHAVIRLYGALTLAQGWLVWQTRRVSDAFVRKTFCQAYVMAYGLQAVALLRAQLTSPDEHSTLNWLNILLFATLTCVYGWFVFVEKLSVFESLDKAVT